MTEEMTASQEPQEITAPQEQTTETTQVQEPQADVQTEQTSEVEASGDNQEQVVQTDGKPQPFIEGLTYTSQEELVKGVKAKDEYIEKLKTDLQAKQQAEQEVYKQLGYQNESQFKNAQVEQQLSTQYKNDVGMVEQAYNTDLITLNNALDNGQMSEYDYQNKVAQLEQAKIDFIAQAKANDMTRRQQAQYQMQQTQAQQFEQQKKSLLDAHPGHEDVIGLFFDSQPTVEKAIALEETIAKRAIEAHEARKKALEQNQADIAKLPKANGATVDGQPKTDYSAAELSTLAETDPEAFAKWCRS